MIRGKLLAGAAVAAICAWGTAASAQTWSNGWYAAADIGYTWPEGIDGTSDTADRDWTFASESSLAGYLRLGTRVAPNWRV